MDTLFVYGTLHPDRAPAEIANVMMKKLRPLGEGTIRARLHHFREYPAIKMDTEALTKVAGHVFRLSNDSDLERLDAYEEYYPAAAEKSLFRRKPVQVRLTNGSAVECWVYEYNGSLPPAKKVKREKRFASPDVAQSR